MAGNLFTFPKPIGWDAGVVQAGSKLTFTATGTTNAQNTFTDLALTVAHANPVVADSEGIFAPIYLDATLPDYRVKYTDSADVLIYQVDDVPASQSGESQTLTGTAPFLNLIETDAAANNGVWRSGVNSEQLTIQLGNDALSSFVDVFTIDRTANTVDTINLKPTTLQHNGVTIATTSADTFTADWSGFTTSPSTIWSYRQTGNIVTVRPQTSLSNVSNTTALTSGATDIPAAIRPTAATVFSVYDVIDNGTAGAGIIQFSSAGKITFFARLATLTFTASGTKGFTGGNVFTYLLD